MSLSSPPPNPVHWVAFAAGRFVVVRARTWFSARARAALELRVAPEELDLRMQGDAR